MDVRWTVKMGVVGLTGLVACAEPSGPKVESPVSAELPPTSGEADLTAWLAEGSYRAWRCEERPHGARSGSAHPDNRVCSNGAIAGHDPATGPWPVGAASVKELYRGGKIVGYAVARKVREGSDAGAWYWYERDNGRLYADGLGTENAPKTLCGGCHEDGADFVFTAVR